jgi:hypothetical protein
VIVVQIVGHAFQIVNYFSPRNARPADRCKAGFYHGSEILCPIDLLLIIVNSSAFASSTVQLSDLASCSIICHHHDDFSLKHMLESGRMLTKRVTRASKTVSFRKSKISLDFNCLTRPGCTKGGIRRALPPSIFLTLTTSSPETRRKPNLVKFWTH